MSRYATETSVSAEQSRMEIERTLDRVAELRGKRLACWCKPEACHGDVLAELADADVLTR